MPVLVCTFEAWLDGFESDGTQAWHSEHEQEGHDELGDAVLGVVLEVRLVELGDADLIVVEVSLVIDGSAHTRVHA
jgi:hypothetical protein